MIREKSSSKTLKNRKTLEPDAETRLPRSTVIASSLRVLLAGAITGIVFPHSDSGFTVHNVRPSFERVWILSTALQPNYATKEMKIRGC